MFGIDEKLIFLIPFFIFIYLIPSIMAAWHKHSKRDAIQLLNILTGWTFIGWVVAAVWAYTENNRNKKK